MEPIKKLVKSLDKKELQCVEQRISFLKEKKQKLLSALLLSCLNGQTLDSYRRSQQIPEYTLTRLKNELTNEILKVLVNRECDEEDVNIDSQLIVCERTIIQARILCGKGLYRHSMELLRNATSIALKMEFYPQLIQIQRLMRDIDRSKPPSAYSGLLHHGDVLKKSLVAEQCFTQLQKHYSSPIKYPRHTIDYTGLEDIGRSALSTGSDRMAYQYYLLSMNKYLHNDQHDEALEFAQALFTLLKQKPGCLNTKEVSVGFLEAASTFIQLQQYGIALSCLEENTELCKAGSLQELYSLDKLFLINLVYGSYKVAQRLLPRAQEHPLINDNPFIASKWTYYEAILHFKMANFKEALKLLRGSFRFGNDTEWMLGCHYLEILVYIETNEYDLCEVKYNAFRRMLTRKSKTNDSDTFYRIKKAMGIVRELIHNEFNFAQVYDKCETDILLLQKSQLVGSWNPYSYEVIRFDQWFMKHVDQNPEKFIWH